MSNPREENKHFFDKSIFLLKFCPEINNITDQSVLVKKTCEKVCLLTSLEDYVFGLLRHPLEYFKNYCIIKKGKK